MVNCCRCNRTGSCRNCACVKAGRSCQSCLPSRLGHCLNDTGSSSPDQPSGTPTTTPSLNASPNGSHDDTPPTLTPTSTPHSPAHSHTTYLTPKSGPVRDVDLPSFTPASNPTFTWGSHNSESFRQALDETYTEIRHWRPNQFKLPQGKAGKHFVSELAKLYKAFATRSALEGVALKAATVLPILALQKPSRSSKNKDHVACLERRMPLWLDGNLAELLSEGRTIQCRLPTAPSSSKEVASDPARAFAKKMFQGKTKAALDHLRNKEKGGVMQLDDQIPSGPGATMTVREVLLDKHPPGQPADPNSVVADEAPPVHDILFDPIDATLIRTAALKTSGSAGPSGLDAYSWRRLCTCHQQASRDLCQALAEVAKRLCTQFVDPASVAPFSACRLIALDKNPGVRPIGVCDTVRRIIAKAILMTIRSDVLDMAGSLQLCAGQISGTEAAVHAVRSYFESNECEAILLVDASNAFNALNRQTALRNIRRLCPALATVLINSYRAEADLLVDGDVIKSREGTTQGDPLAMPMYAIATIPLIKRLSASATVNQVWYADDAAGMGRIDQTRLWWDKLVELGPGFGYYANASKTWLITKEAHHQKAIEAFSGTGVKVTSCGRPYLGSPIGSRAFIESFVEDKVKLWAAELDSLSCFAKTQPHAAYSAFTHGLTSIWSYLIRTTPETGHLLQPLEDIIRMKLIPVLTDRAPPNDVERNLLALPARLGGIGVSNPATDTQSIFSASTRISEPLKDAILAKVPVYSYDMWANQVAARSKVHKLRRQQSEQQSETLKQILPDSQKRAMELASEKGASTWLTTLPVEEFGFTLHKSAFHDALALRYGWKPNRTPQYCACSSAFSVEHALSCPKGGFPTIRHNEIRDLTASLLTEVCHEVSIEPDLQPISGEIFHRASTNIQDGARLDVAMSGFWGGRHERSFCDVRVFNPHAPSNRNSNLASCYRRHERLKKNSYEQRIRDIEHASFTPLIFSATGGLGNEAKTFYKRHHSSLQSGTTRTAPRWPG